MSLLRFDGGMQMNERAQQVMAEEAARQALIRQKYPPDVAERIIKREIWQGMSAEQLQNTLGKADEVRQTVMKRKTKEVWQYEMYSIRITLEEGVVVGWRDWASRW